MQRAFRLVSAICCFAFATVVVAAPPAISNLSLRGLQIGATTTLVIDGTNLLPQPQLLLQLPIAKQTVRPGATATHVEIEVTLDAGVAPGIYHLRVASGGGISSAIAVGVDTLPQRPIGSSATPLSPVSLPAAFSGALSGGQTADTIVTLNKGQQIAIEVEARRLGGALDPVIHVYDHRGVPLAWAEGTNSLGSDARLVFAAPADGSYRVELHDAVYQAGNPGFYRLKIGAWYFAGLVFPPVVQRGTKATLEFADTNLPAGSKVEFNMPADSGDLPAPWPAGVEAAGFRPVVLASDVPEFVQSSSTADAPKDSAKSSLQQFVAPAGISGRLTPAKEDEYRVTVEPNERLRFEVLGARIGSPVDCELAIRDEHGGQLAANDDQPGTIDPGLDFNVPGNSHAVVVAIKDVTGRGGPDCIYHLAITRLDRPNFSLSLENDRSQIPPGGLGLLRIAARRTDYNGPIALSFQGLPVGVTVKDAVIDAGTNEALVSLAAADGLPEAGIVTITGTATEDSTKIVRIAELPAVAETVWQPWLRSEFAIARTGPPSISIAWANPAADPTFKPGEKVPLAVKFNRGAEVSGKALAAGGVRLSLVSSQPMPEKKVRIKDKKKKTMEKEVDDPKRALRLDGAAMIPPQKTDTTVQLLVPGDLRASEYELAIRAELLAADGKNAVATTYTPVMRINVAPPPAKAPVAKTEACRRRSRPDDASAGEEVAADRGRSHLDSVARAERYARPQLDRMIGDEIKSKSLRDRRHDQRRFEHRQRRSDAQAWPTAKREIRELRQMPHPIVRPALGTEFFRSLEIPRIAMADPLAHQERCADGNIEPADLARFFAHPPHREHRRIEPHGLRHDMFDIL